jgi:hypothetical protein
MAFFTKDRSTDGIRVRLRNDIFRDGGIGIIAGLLLRFGLKVKNTSTKITAFARAKIRVTGRAN